MRIKNYEVSPALLVIDMQNGFASKDGSYDALGIESQTIDK
jgi:nicotinamidase-related amidase